MAKKFYYNIFDDIKAYPDARAYMIIGGRSTGKTYGALKGSYQEHLKFIFAKRTADDVKLMCSGVKMTKAEKEKEIARLEKQMKEAARMMEYEYAAILRDQIIELRGNGI